MTTEIAVLNKSAVALAADSAVTVSTRGPAGDERKVYNTANKVFSLSKYAPVGIMTYGSVELMGVPWETIIKMYRQYLGKKRFDSLIGYCQSFFDFLADMDFSHKARDAYILKIASGIFGNIRRQLDDEVQAMIDSNQSVDENIIKAMLRQYIDSKNTTFENIGKRSVCSVKQKANIASDYRPRIIDIAKNSFENRPLTTADRSKLVKIVVNAASVCPRNVSGIVIAGYGEKEMFPSYYDFDVAGVLVNKVVKQDKGTDSVREENKAIIAPFAQSNDVMTFITGMGDDISKFFSDALGRTIKENFPKDLAAAIQAELKLNKLQSHKILSIAKKMGTGSYDTIIKKLDTLKSERYIGPVIIATQFLQKGELASMAETLVNMVSFRKQVTLETETVGGPIDVAVITKGDGFIWIRRKHYFDSDLNHHFLATYFDNGARNE